MKRFDLTYTDGPGSDHRARVIIEAENPDEAMQKAYRRPEADQYRDVWVSERVEGTTAYMVAFNYNYVFNGQVDKQTGEGYIIINADDEAEAKRAYHKMFLDKYFDWLYPNKNNIMDHIPTERQGGKYGRAFDAYQIWGCQKSDELYAKDILK